MKFNTLRTMLYENIKLRSMILSWSFLKILKRTQLSDRENWRKKDANTSDGFTNGAQGEVLNIKTQQDKAVFIMVIFYNTKVGYEQSRILKSKISVEIKEYITSIGLHNYS